MRQMMNQLVIQSFSSHDFEQGCDSSSLEKLGIHYSQKAVENADPFDAERGFMVVQYCHKGWDEQRPESFDVICLKCNLQHSSSVSQG